MGTANEVVVEGQIDVALLDVDLGSGSTYDLARSLRARQIPFLFLTGYDGSIIPADLAGAPAITKPAAIEHVAHELARLRQT